MIEAKIALRIHGAFRLRKPESIEDAINAVAEETGIDADVVREVYNVERTRLDAARIERIRKAESKPVSGGALRPDYSAESYPGPIIVTAAQNNTEIASAFWQNMVAYAEKIGAKIVVAPILYNKSAWNQPDDMTGQNIYFDPKVKPYMRDDRFTVHGVTVLANAHVLPTAKNPLSGFESATDAGQSIVIPASKIALKTMPRLKGEPLKIVQSTGAVTVCNYVQRKAGTVAELEHNYGFTVIEPGGKIRSVECMNPDDGGFFDFDGEQVNEQGIRSKNPSALIFGDIHAEKLPIERLNALTNLAVKINPCNVIFHDILDFSSRNHHNRESSLFRFKADSEGHTVENDISKVAQVLNAFESYAPIVVDSNHDRALERWLDEADYREDSQNAILFLELQLARYRATMNGEHINLLEYAVTEPFGRCYNTTFLQPDESFKVAGIECGNHGDRGPNGARGSLQAFRAIGEAMVIGHSHSPGIAGKVYQVGVSGSLDMGYNVGPSSWAHAHCIIFANGQRQMIFE